MTMRYAHPTPENKRKAVNALAIVFGEERHEEDKGRRREQVFPELRDDVSTEITNN